MSLAKRGALSPFRRDLVDEVRRVTAVDREDGQGGSSLPLRRLARAVHEPPATARTRRARTSRRSGPTGSTTRRQARRSGAGPSSIERWERAREAHPPSEPELLRASRRLSRTARDPLPLNRLPSAWRPCGAVRCTSPRASGIPEIVAELRRDSRLQVTARQGLGVEHLELRVDAGGHPRSGEQARSARARVRHRPRPRSSGSSIGEVDPKLRLLDSMVLPTQSPAYASNWRTYRHNAGLARRLLEQAGCRLGADGIYVCGDRRLSLRFVTRAGVPVRARVLAIIQRQLRQVGIAVEPDFASSAVLFGRIIPSGEFDVALFSWIYSPESSGLKDVFGCGAVDNAMGYCQRLVTREFDQADRILDSGRRARSPESCRSPAGQGRPRASPVSVRGARRAQDVAARCHPHSGYASCRRGELVARAGALAAALAAALLAVPGAGGAGAQAPQRGGTLTISRPQPAVPSCLNPFACGINGRRSLR